MIYDKEFLTKNHICYAMTRHEDVIFLQKATYLAQSIQSVDKTMFLYRNNAASETHRKQKAEDLYVPILNSWMELLEWHEKEHATDEAIIAYVKHMICVYAIEGLEMLYQENRREAEQHIIAKREFEKYLTNYQVDLSSAQRQVDRVAKYFEHYEQFVKENRIAGLKKRMGKRLTSIGFIRELYEKKKYKEVLPESICVR